MQLGALKHQGWPDGLSIKIILPTVSRTSTSASFALIGLVCLIFAGLSTRIHPTTTTGKDLGDAFSGLLYGLAIGCMLFGIWKTARRSDDAGPPKQTP